MTPRGLLPRTLLLLAWFGCPSEPPGSKAVREGAAGEGAALERGDYEGRRQAIVGELDQLVADLGEEGRYDCCIQKPCGHCARMAGGCRCGEALRKGEPVCEECALMWRKGQGAEPGVDPQSVRSFLEAMDKNQGHPACGCGKEGSSAGPEPTPTPPSPRR